MLNYNILENGYKIGIAKGKSNAFKFIQKEIERTGNLGYWSVNKYISNEGKNYSMEVADNE